MAAQKTQCPFCESIFAVTPEQLSARGGHVRCGKCFQVFKADQHLKAPTPLGATPAPSRAAAAPADIFDLLDQPNLSAEDSDTLAGQPVVPESLPSARHNTRSSITKASDLGKLEQKTDLEPDFDALFAALAPQPIDPDAGLVQSKLNELDPSAVLPAVAPVQPSNRPATPAPVSPPPKTPSTTSSAMLGLDLSPLSKATPAAAQIQDTPPPGSVPAIVLPSLGKPTHQTKSGQSVFNKKQITSAKLSSLKLDDELSELFLGDGFKSPKKDPLAHQKNDGVEKLSKSADESWADALLLEEEEAKKIAAEQQAAALLGSQKPPSVLKPAASSASHQAQPKAALNKSVLSPPDQSTHRSVSIEEDDLLSYLSQVGAASEKPDDLNHRHGSRTHTPQPQVLPPPASHRVRIPVKQRRSMGHYVVWGLLCSVLVLLLAVQWLYFNFADLAGKPEHNSRLTMVCAVVGCQIPAMDLSQISTGRIRLQRHPDDRNTTKVTLNLTNQANNSQIMPKIKFLQLKQGQVEAYRVVEPHEYLQGNDRQLRQMLPRQTLKAEFVLDIERSSIGVYAIDPVY